MGLLTGVSSFFGRMGELGAQTAQKLSSIFPISNVSTKPVETKKTYSTTVKFLPDTITNTPIEKISLTNPFRTNQVITMGEPIRFGGKEMYLPMGLKGRPIYAEPIYQKYPVTSPKKSLLPKTFMAEFEPYLKETIRLGATYGISKLNPDYKISPEVIFNPNRFTFPQINGFEQSPVIEWVKPIVQPAISEGVERGITQSVQRPPIWIWFLIGGMILLFTMRR